MVIWLKLPAQPSAEKWILKTSLSNLGGSWFLCFCFFFRTNNSEFENAALEEDMQSPSEGSRVMCLKKKQINKMEACFRPMTSGKFIFNVEKSLDLAFYSFVILR